MSGPLRAARRPAPEARRQLQRLVAEIAQHTARAGREIWQIGQRLETIHRQQLYQAAGYDRPCHDGGKPSTENTAHEPTNALALPPDLAAFVRHQVERGSYENALEVIRDAFSFLQGHRDKVEQLAKALDEGIAQLDAGEGEVVDPGELTADIRKELDLPPRDA